MRGIYAYVDTMNNSVVYVGKDSNIDRCRRNYEHMSPSAYNKQKINRVLQNNPNRYEYKEVFVFDEISPTELNLLEMQQIAFFNPKFNFTKGGEGTSGYKLSEEHKKKISRTVKGENNPFFGKTHSEEFCRKQSETQNTTGYYRVSKHKNKTCKQGFIWMYRYYEKGKRKSIESVNIEKLEEKVKAKGLEWYKLEEVEDE